MLKQAEYEQHEFVKMNQIGDIVNNAMQVVFRALNQKDKVTLACKTMIRALNTKLQAHDMMLNQM